MAKAVKNNGQSGFTLLEMIAAVTILGAVVLGSANMINRTVDDTKANVTALYMKSVSNAANEYIQNNFVTVHDAARATTNPIVISIATLSAAGHLPAGFSALNPYGQDTCVLVKSPSVNNLVAMLATDGGQAIDDLSLGQIAGGIGSAGGAIYAQDTTVIRGTMGGWSFAKTEFENAGTKCDGSAGTVALSEGHPVVALWFAEGNTVNATLYRNAVPSNQALNTMQTPIILGEGTENTAGTRCTTLGMFGRDSTGAVLSCDGTNWKRQSSNFWADPVLNFAALPASDEVGSVRMTLDNSRAFMFTGAAWQPLSVDENGDMMIPRNLDVAGRIKMYEHSGSGTIEMSSGANNFYLKPEGLFFRIKNTALADITSIDQSGNLTTEGDVYAKGNMYAADNRVAIYHVPGVGVGIDLRGEDISTGNWISIVNESGQLTVNGASKQLFRADQNGNFHTNGNSTANGDMVATGNISSGETLSGAYAKLTVISNAGDGCAPEGLISMDNSGRILVCNGSVWAAGFSQQAGEICGMKMLNGDGANCRGFDPRTSCPDGYVQMAPVANAGDNAMYYFCTKV